MIPGLLAALTVLAPLQIPSRTEPAAHPRDPWVFRSVLDGRARMVTVALDEDVWLAYDATTGRLVKAWKGDVDFEGAVYTTEHGPQPTSRGTTYLLDESEESAFEVREDGRLLASTTTWLGYRLEDGEVILRYRIALEDGRRFEVEESPRTSTVSGENDGGSRALSRLMRTTAPDPLEVRLAPWTDEPGRFAFRVPSAFEPGDGDFATPLLPRGAPDVDEGALRRGDEHELATPASPQKSPRSPESDAERTTIPMTFAAPVIDGVVDDLWSHATPQPLGRLVFGALQNDADLGATFRALYDVDNLYVLFEVVDDEVVNDSSQTFNDDAVEVYLDGGGEKQDFYDANDFQYVFGFGDEDFWVTNQPGMHPGVRFASARTDDGYRLEVALLWANAGVAVAPGLEIGLELHVDDDDDGREMDAAAAWHSESTNAWSDASVFATVALGAPEAGTPRALGPREPGLALRAWSVGRAMARLERLVPGQTPNVSIVVPAVDLDAPEDFGGLADQFLVELTGWLSVGRAGAYAFRLVSDDGSRLWIDNQPVVDNDGLHGPEPAEGALELAAGPHALRIDYFEETGGELLTLLWEPPGAADFEPVPPEALSTPAGEVRVTSPGHKRLVPSRAVVRPGDLFPLEDVHPAFDLAQARPESFQPKVGGLDFLPDGRLVVCTWDPDGSVWVLDGVEGDDPEAIGVTRIAAGLAEPLGLEVVDGRIFVLQKQELTELVDHDGDGLTDEYRCVANGWGVTPNFHEFAFGLVHANERFYATLAVAIEPGGASSWPQDPDRGRVIEIAPDGSYRFVAQGLRTPNGIGLGPEGRIFLTDNQGDWLPASKLLCLAEGAFYGNRSVDPEGTADLEVTPPVVWLPQGEIGNSPSQPIALVEGPYAGQLAHGEVTHGGLKRVFVEEVDGVLQGAAFRFCQGLEAGVNRVVRGPDGALYAGGIGSTGNWGQDGKRRYGLQRLRYNGTSVFELLAVRARSNGLELELTEPLPEGHGWNPVDYEVAQWRYVPTDEYGGPKIDETWLDVLSASVSDDRRRVFLELDGMRAGHVLHVRLAGPFASESGRAPWSTEAWYTLNRIPKDLPGEVRPSPLARPLNALTAEERAAGFELLFDGSSLEHWRGWRRDDVPGGWTAEDGAIVFRPGPDPTADAAADPTTDSTTRGDLATREEYDSFELRLEWKITEGGNSGIIFHATEDHDWPWETGPEMQVLDDAAHPDGGNPATSAGANYALHAPARPAARRAGTWNEVRLVVDHGHVEHWLNGYRIVAYTLGDDDWKTRVRASKFAAMPDYGIRASGHVVLQDHGDEVCYRNLRIRRLGN